MPDRRTRQGKRDLALLPLLGSVGLRRAEASRVLLTDIDERRRASDPRLRQAIKGSTAWWAIVRYGKRGRSRAVPLDEDALAAIVAWVKSRPTAATDHLLLSLPRMRSTTSAIAAPAWMQPPAEAPRGPERARWIPRPGALPSSAR